MYAQTVSIVHEDAYQAGRQTAAERLAQMGRAPDVVTVIHDETFTLALVSTT